MEQYTGFEPVPSAWKADMLAIEHQYCIWSGWQDSNLRHRDPKSRILPTELYPDMNTEINRYYMIF